MRKIPTLFVRDPDDRKHVLPEVTPGCEWVLAGEGVATRKFDGTCTRLTKDGLWWARREVKPGKQPPVNFVPVEHDETTGKTVGWEPIEQSSHYKTFLDVAELPTAEGTYELVGPKINGNPEGYPAHWLFPHGDAVLFVHARDFDGLRDYLLSVPYEGIVWHHPDGRMAKLKRRDFPRERPSGEDSP